MISRALALTINDVARQLPVIALRGPGQSGKTTLSRTMFPHHLYLSLEDLDIRLQATQDPRAFLEFHRNTHGIILDEIQNAPTLLSYIQTFVDKENVLGYFVLTGSQNFLINQAITQTLAGRMAILTLLPLSITELADSHMLPQSIEEFLYQGTYPRLHTQTATPAVWYPSYTLSYLERDVRQATTVQDLVTFQLFLKMCAGTHWPIT